MFEYKVPTLKPGPLKKEILHAMQNIALHEQELRYKEYSDGIITGCELFEENMHIGIAPGILKFGGRIYVLHENISVSYKSTEEWTLLKVVFSPQKQHPEYTIFQGNLVLDTNVTLLPNELEMGRFKLKKGARLRTFYENFADMQTEFDTVNLGYIKKALPEKHTLHPAITKYFAQETYILSELSAKDESFISACLNSTTGIPADYIDLYIEAALHIKLMDTNNFERQGYLTQILEKLSGNKQKSHSRGNQIMMM